MAGSVNKVILEDLYIAQTKSIPQIANILGMTVSTTRASLIRAGVPLRSRAEGVRAARDRLGVQALGVRREFSEAHRESIKASAIARGERLSKGFSLKPSGYLEYTRGPHKGRSLHVIAMESRIGRRLLPDEHVHHIDGNKTNNSIDNLALVTRSGHARLHRREEKLSEGGHACLEQ